MKAITVRCPVLFPDTYHSKVSPTRLHCAEHDIDILRVVPVPAVCGFESSLEFSFFTVHVISLDFQTRKINVGSPGVYVGTAVQNRQR